MLQFILCGWESAAGALSKAERNFPGIIPWLFLSAIGAGIIAAIAFGVAYMFTDGQAGKDKENAKTVGGITFIVFMVISIIVYISQ